MGEGRNIGNTTTFRNTKNLSLSYGTSNIVHNNKSIEQISTLTCSSTLKTMIFLMRASSSIICSICSVRYKSIGIERGTNPYTLSDTSYIHQLECRSSRSSETISLSTSRITCAKDNNTKICTTITRT